MTKMFDLIYDKINNTRTNQGSELLKNIIFGKTDKNYNLIDVVKSTKENLTIKNKLYKHLNKYKSNDVYDKITNLLDTQSVTGNHKYINIPFSEKINKSIKLYSIIVLIIVYILIYLVIYISISSNNENNNEKLSFFDFFNSMYKYQKSFFSQITYKISSDNTFNDFCGDIFTLFCISAQIIVLYNVGYNSSYSFKKNKDDLEDIFQQFINNVENIIENDVFTKNELLKKTAKKSIKMFHDITMDDKFKLTKKTYNKLIDNISNINNYVAQLDVQLMLSDMVINNGYCVPEFIDERDNDGTEINIHKMFNPLMDKPNENIIKNNFVINDKYNKNMFIIGGGCGNGKSYYLLSIYLCVWMSHVLDIAPCENIKLHNYDFVLNIKQNNSSALDIEQLENIKNIINSNQDKKIFLINDNNLCKNLSFQENVAILFSFYDSLAKNKNLISVVTTNNDPLYICDTTEKSIQILNFNDVGTIHIDNNNLPNYHKKNNFKLNALSILGKKYGEDDVFIKKAKQKLQMLPK